MINLGQYSIDEGNVPQPIQEGSLGNIIKTATDIDTKEIKDAWDGAINNGDTGGLLKTLDDNFEKGAKTSSKINNVLNKHTVDTRSIIARARNSVLQFPVYVPQTIRVNEAHIIGKMFERVYATFVQAVLAQNPIMSEEEANNLVFLRKFHSNIKEAADVLVNKYYEPIDEIDQMMQESVFFEQQLTSNCSVRFSVVPTTDEYLIKENARLMNEPLTGFSQLFTEADKVSTNSNSSSDTTVQSSYEKLSEKDLEEMARNKADLSNIEKRYLDMSASDLNNEIKNAFPNKTEEERSAIYRTRLHTKKAAENKVDDEIKNLKDEIKKGNIVGKEYRNGEYVKVKSSKTTKTSTSTSTQTQSDPKAVDAPKLLRDSDIKKQNGLLPYTIEATFLIRDPSGNKREVRYIIGVKSTMHLFRTQDLADDLQELVMGKSKTLKKIRYKTGEINFLDYFINLKGIKSDAAKHINYNKRWINTLKRLADYRDMNGALMKGQISSITNGQVPIPNGTLVLSQPDVVTLTNQTGIDLSVVSNAKRLARSLFLIAVVIVDSSAGTMRVLFTDMDNEWDVQSLAAIDAELSKTDNSSLMRELNRMVNK